jgi:hypothetical protein
MTTVICNRIEYALSTDAILVRGNIEKLKDGKSWIRILSDSQPIYSQTSAKQDQGKIISEKLTFSRLSTDPDDLKALSDLNMYLVVKVHVNGGFFIMGDTTYPVIVEYDDNGSVTNYNFSCQHSIV